MTTCPVRLDQIAFNAGTQIRAAINEAVVTEYAERMTEGVVFPAIVLFHDGSQYFLADGFHRVLAAQRNQFRDLDADVHPGTKTDALWFALGANKANGQRLTDTDKKHAILLAIEAWPERPAGDIASQIGCGRSWVSELRAKQDSATGNLSRVTGKDGKTYPASRHTPAAEPPVEPKFKSRAAVAQRKQDVRDMAERGYTTRQIAATLNIDETTVGVIAKKESIRIHADRVVGKTRRHDSARIVDTIVMDAEHLTADVNLIAFDDLPNESIARWVDSLAASHKSLATFIRRLKKEQNRVQAA